LPLTEQAIAERVFSAVMEQRIPPGTKLSENALCDIYGVSRARIRRALLVLAQRKIVDLHSNRGAFVASPSPDEARNVFAARRAIEPTIVRNVVTAIDDAQIADLQDHVDRESAAHVAGNRHEAIRLSGSFHIKLAEIAGNPILTGFIEELVARTSLIIGLFGSPGIASCLDGEHRAIIGIIAARDAAEAASWMVKHLDHIQSELELTSAPEAEIDIRAILGSGGAPPASEARLPQMAAGNE
jgi:DNA-binding GntR family transcriptional regulator